MKRAGMLGRELSRLVNRVALLVVVDALYAAG